MEQESLYRVRKKIIEILSHMDSLPLQDRVELMINLLHFLDDNEYEDNVKTLQLKKQL